MVSENISHIRYPIEREMQILSEIGLGEDELEYIRFLKDKERARKKWE